MRTSILSALLLLLASVAMAQVKIRELPEETTPAAEDAVLLSLAEDGGSRHALVGNLIGGMSLENAATTCEDAQGWIADAGQPICADVCLADGTGCPVAPAFGQLSDVNLTGVPSGGTALFNGIGYVASTEAVCLEDGTNCPTVGWIDEAGELATSDGVAPWLSNSGGTVLIDGDVTGATALSVSESGGAVRIIGATGQNMVLGPASNAYLILEFNGSQLWRITASALLGLGSGDPMIVRGPGSAGAPNLVPYGADADTGYWCDGTNTCHDSAGGEIILSRDNDGTDHEVTVTGDTTQTGPMLSVVTSGGSPRFEVTTVGPRVAVYTIVPSCGAAEAGTFVGDSDSTPPTACYCNGTDWQPLDATAVGACNES